MMDVSVGSDECRLKMQAFLDNECHTANFLSRHTSGVGSSRLRSGLPPMVLMDLVCVQLGNYFWSEECMGLTDDELIFIKPSGLLSSANRLRLPIGTIIGVKSVDPTAFPFQLRGPSRGIVISTFSRQFSILLPSATAVEGWMHHLRSMLEARQQQADVAALQSFPVFPHSSPQSQDSKKFFHLDFFVKTSGENCLPKYIIE